MTQDIFYLKRADKKEAVMDFKTGSFHSPGGILNPRQSG
jgi:hypothetical protein